MELTQDDVWWQDSLLLLLNLIFWYHCLSSMYFIQEHLQQCVFIDCDCNSNLHLD